MALVLVSLAAASHARGAPTLERHVVNQMPLPLFNRWLGGGAPTANAATNGGITVFRKFIWNTILRIFGGQRCNDLAAIFRTHDADTAL